MGLESLSDAIQRVRSLSAYATYKEKLTNTFGVVVECDAPRQTSGTDLIQTIRLVDESCPDGVSLCVFGPQVDTMPAAQLGDVLELQNVVVQFWQDRPQLFAKLSRPHSFGYRLYRGISGLTNNTNINNSSGGAGSSSLQLAAVPAAAAAAAAAQAVRPVQVFNATPDSRHAGQRLQELQAVRVQALGRETASDASHVYLRRIRELQPPEEEGARPACVDLRVRVLAIDRRRACEVVVMWVWDATDARPVPASLQMPPSEWKGTLLQPPHPRRHVMPLVAQPPGLQVLADVPSIGTALPVIVLPGAVPSTGLPEVGAWVKVKVVGLAVVQGQWQAVFGKPSRLTQSQPSPAAESLLLTRLANQDVSEWPEDPEANVLTRCSLPTLPRTTIRGVMQGVAERRPGPFRVQVRLVGHLPQELREWCKLRPRQPGSGSSGGGSSGGQQQQQQQWEWAAHLWLEDATGDLRALLLGQEGTKLLGLPPQCLLSSSSSSEAVVQQLRSRLQRLGSVDEGGGVWMDVALTPLYPAANQQQQQQQQRAPGQQGGGSPGQQQQQQQQGPTGSQEQQQQLQLVPFGQQQASPQAGSQEQQASPTTGSQQQLQQRAATAAPAPPVFVLHDAVLIPENLQQLEGPEQQRQQQQLVVHTGGGDRPPTLPQLQQGGQEQEQQHEGIQQPQKPGQQREGSRGRSQSLSSLSSPPQLQQFESDSRQLRSSSNPSSSSSPSEATEQQQQQHAGSKRRRRDG